MFDFDDRVVLRVGSTSPEFNPNRLGGTVESIHNESQSFYVEWDNGERCWYLDRELEPEGEVLFEI